MQIRDDFKTNSSVAHNRPRAIQRVHPSFLSSPEFVEQYVHRGVPVIVSGLLEQEPVWDLPYLMQHLGDLEFPVRYYGRDRYQQDKRQWTSSGSGVTARTLPFSTYATMLQTGEAAQQDAYLARCSLAGTTLATPPNLTRAEQWMGMKWAATGLNLWVGPGGHTSCLHYDPMDSVLIQLHGAKKILLFPPHQIYNLYPIPVYKQLRYGLKLRPVYSQVYPESPDFEAFPRLRQALDQQLSGTLNAGEILLIPAGWWHEVTSLGDGMVCSINRFWNVAPLSRALLSWNKWRAHLGSAFALPHTLSGLAAAICSPNAKGDLKTLIQRL